MVMDRPRARLWARGLLSRLARLARLAPMIASVLAMTSIGCFGLPSPLAPELSGSVGLPHQGVITNAAALPRQGEGYRLFRKNGIHWGNPRLVAAIKHAAGVVAKARPGPPLVIGDLSARFGGFSSGHRSHRTGRDADLLIYALTPDGRPVASPGFLEFGPDGLARAGDAKSKKVAFFRIDVEREWLLIKALVTSREANVQWLFIARWLEALIIEHARARGEDPELVWHAENVLLQPGDSGAHDDHLHLRIACTPEEAVAGCQGGGPYWPWIPPLPQLVNPPDDDLARAIVGDLLPGAAPPGAAPSPPRAAGAAP